MGYRRYTIDDWRAVRRALARGGTVRGVAEETGVGRGAVFQWARRDAPPGRVWATMVEEARGGGRYDPREAQGQAEALARRPKERKLDADPLLRAYVAGALALRWSPEQISSRIREEFPDDGAMRVSHETIYLNVTRFRLQVAFTPRAAVPRLPPRTPWGSCSPGRSAA